MENMSGTMIKGYELLDRIGALGVSWSPDECWFALGVLTGPIQLIDADSLEVARELVGHTVEVRGMMWSADSQRLLSSADDNTIRIWDVEKKVEIIGYEGIWGRFSPDDTQVMVTSQEGFIYIYPTWPTLDEQLADAKEQVVRELTSAERFILGLPPLEE
jgi:WD40 repeat protein